MYVYRVAWHFFINVSCKLHHNPESGNTLGEKSNGLHANGYQLVCFALPKSTCAVLRTVATLYVAVLIGFTGLQRQMDEAVYYCCNQQGVDRVPLKYIC